MSELDRVREQIAYLKFWLGIAIATNITLIGWLLSTSEPAVRMIVVLAFVAVGVLSFAVVLIHRQIQRRIAEVGKL